MLTSGEPFYRQSLPEDLTLRTVATADEIERLAAFSATIFGPELAPLTRDLLYRHPYTQGRDFVFVEDGNGQILSSLCLIPWTWRYDGVELPVGEMGIVGTLEAYRRRGLVRVQVDYFKRRLRERGCLLSCIQGIPYYYRQFGYEYALPLEGGWRIELRHVPAPADPAFSVRLATGEDIAVLSALYEQAAARLAIHTVRDEATWRYLLTAGDPTSAMTHETRIVQDGAGRPVGYARVPAYHFGDELAVDEVSNLDIQGALALLHHLRALASVRAKPGIRLNLPAACDLVVLARALGAHDLGTYAWQVHIPDQAALLRALTPVLERRLAASMFAGATRDVTIGFYRDSIRLRFQAGTLAAVDEDGPAHGDVNLPRPAFVPLLCGYRTVYELRAAYPDVSWEPMGRLLVDTLFPPMRSFIHTSY